MRFVLAPALAGLALAACSTVEPVVAPVAAAPKLEPSAPAPVAGYDWHLTTDDGSARLAYGVEASDDLRLGFDCTAGSGKVDVTATAPTGERVIRLESGGDTLNLDAEGEASELSDGDLLTGVADADEPVFLRFRRLGWIAQWTDGDHRDVYAPHPGAQADVERFFALCD